MSESTAQDGGPISFREKLAGSQAFSALFRDGMSLVEETAAYLDGPGRKESKALPRAAALAYATESMRLTTRLMQLASWLLLHRAVKEGEMTLAQAHKEKSKVRLAACDPGDAKSIVTDQPLAHAHIALPVITKSTIPAFNRALAMEYVSEGIRANTISPAVVDTPMHAKDDHEVLKKLLPIPRLVQVSEIVDALLYLESAPMVNGENIRIDGGAHAGAKS